MSSGSHTLTAIHSFVCSFLPSFVRLDRQQYYAKVRQPQVAPNSSGPACLFGLFSPPGSLHSFSLSSPFCSFVRLFVHGMFVLRLVVMLPRIPLFGTPRKEQLQTATGQSVSQPLLRTVLGEPHDHDRDTYEYGCHLFLHLIPLHPKRTKAEKQKMGSSCCCCCCCPVRLPIILDILSQNLFLPFFPSSFLFSD